MFSLWRLDDKVGHGLDSVAASVARWIASHYLTIVVKLESFRNLHIFYVPYVLKIKFRVVSGTEQKNCTSLSSRGVVKGD
jgi:hypothetical protein